MSARSCGICSPKIRAYESDEEGNDVDDAQRKARLQHGAGLVRIDAEISSIVRCTSIHVRAVCSAWPAQIVYSGDECTHQSQVEPGDEECVMSGTQIVDGGEECPGERYHRHYEEHEDVAGREEVGVDVLVDEPGEHAHDRDGDDDLEHAPREEEGAGNHGGCGAGVSVRSSLRRRRGAESELN